MDLALTILLMLFYLQALAKFGIWLLVPYSTRINRIASYYARSQRVIGIYDSVTLVLIVAMVALLFATDMQARSFVTGLLVGMLVIQVFFHRFNRVLPDAKSPAQPAPPNQQMSYAIQAAPGLAWREILVMTALSGWALFVLITQGLIG